MKYELWSDENIKELRESFYGKDSDAKAIGEGVIEIIKEANKRHHLAMVELELKILKDK